MVHTIGLFCFAWVRSRARPGLMPGPKGSRPDSPCALVYRVSDPSRSRGGAHPGPSWSHPGPELFLPGSGLDRPKQTSWPLLSHISQNPREDFAGDAFLRASCPASSSRKHISGAKKHTQNFGGCPGFLGVLLMRFFPIRSGATKHINKFLPPTQSQDNPFFFPCM